MICSFPTGAVLPYEERAKIMDEVVTAGKVSLDIV